MQERLTTRGTDALLAACLVGVAVLGAASGAGTSAEGDLDPGAWWQWVLVAMPSVPIAFRRSHTRAATVCSILAQMVVWVSGLSSPFLAPLVMIYTSAAEPSATDRRIALGASGALAATAAVGVFYAPDVTPDLLLLTVLSCAAGYVLGVNVADQRAAAAKLAADLAVADVERSVAQERAAVAERQRVTRELHDIVGHSLSVIAVRAEAATRVGAKNPNAAIEAAEATGQIARSALADVRRVLTGLRNDDSVAELDPLPTIDDLPALVAATEKAGVAIELVAPLPSSAGVGATVGISAYRIVQEALTNVIRHAGPSSTVQLRVELEGDVLLVQVDDDGVALGPDGAMPQPGTGLTGMGERVAVLGGTLAIGHRPGGGFGVRAALPLHPAEVAS